MTQQPVTERVHALERQFEGLQAEVIAGARQAIDANRTTTRIAEAAASSPQSNDNTFPIIFIDGTYNRVAGQQTPTYRNRQNLAREYCYNLAGGVPPLGTKIVVHFWSGRWWTFWSTGGQAPPPANSKAGVTNIFDAPHWYHWGGVNDGTLASTADQRRCVPSQETASYWCYFQQQTGPDIGLEVGPDYDSQIRMTEPGIFRWDFVVRILPGVFLSSPGMFPHDPFIWQAEIWGHMGSLARRAGIFPFAAFPIGSHTFRTADFPDLTGQLAGQYYDVGNLHEYAHLSTVIDSWNFTPPTEVFINFSVNRSQVFTPYVDITDYGHEFLNPVLTVTRLD